LQIDTFYGSNHEIVLISFKVHVSESSTTADHCRSYALSDPKDSHFQSVCDHEHHANCDRCNLLTNTMDNVEKELAEQADNLSEELKEELTFRIRQAKLNIVAWKSHLLRSVNQDDARLEILDKLDKTSLFLVQDWAMKYLPRKFRESQTDWFGKRGISWHVTVATRRGEDGKLQMLTFVHVFKACKQDSFTVLAVMADVIEQLKIIMPQLRSVFYRQDNAGCYHGAATILCAHVLGQRHGVTIKRLDFSDPQGGKGACDRKAATIKSHMRIFLNAGNDIESPEQMIQAILSSGGIPALHLTLSGPPKVLQLPTFKLEGVSLMSNVEYTKDKIRVWKAYDIGPGKLIQTREEQHKPNESDLPSLTVITRNNADFAAVKSRRGHSSQTVDVEQSDEEPSTSSEGDTSINALFSCPEEGCAKTFLRHCALERHLDCGKHQRVVEQETLLDKAIIGYAEKLETQFEAIPEIEATEESDQHFQSKQNVAQLPLGWALKSSLQRRTRFSEAQKNYLYKKFQLGETTGHKADSTSVARSMMIAKDIHGNLLFTSNEFLTSHQISSYFSRLASKKSIPDENIGSDDELESATQEAGIQELMVEVQRELALEHPILYDVYNICDLVKQSKLSKFAIPMLQNICHHLEIDTDDIKVRRKIPYIEKIELLSKCCVCQQ